MQLILIGWLIFNLSNKLEVIADSFTIVKKIY